jgi:hypothetical protein
MNLEAGDTKRLSPKSIEYLCFVGIDGKDMQMKLDQWQSEQYDSRKKNVLKANDEAKTDPEVPEIEQKSSGKPTKTVLKRENAELLETSMEARPHILHN